MSSTCMNIQECLRLPLFVYYSGLYKNIPILLKVIIKERNAFLRTVGKHLLNPFLRPKAFLSKRRQQTFELQREKDNRGSCQPSCLSHYVAPRMTLNFWSPCLYYLTWFYAMLGIKPGHHTCKHSASWATFPVSKVYHFVSIHISVLF